MCKQRADVLAPPGPLTTSVTYDDVRVPRHLRAAEPGCGRRLTALTALTHRCCSLSSSALSTSTSPCSALTAAAELLASTRPRASRDGPSWEAATGDGTYIRQTQRGVSAV